MNPDSLVSVQRMERAVRLATLAGALIGDEPTARKMLIAEQPALDGRSLLDASESEEGLQAAEALLCQLARGLGLLDKLDEHFEGAKGNK